MIVFRATTRTTHQPAVVAEELEGAGGIHQRLPASVARETCGAAWHGCEHIVCVHRADDESIPVPRSPARSAAQGV